MSAKTRDHKQMEDFSVSIDSIAIESGPQYQNWKIITKQKLKERESYLIRIKIAEIEAIINKNL